MNASSKVFISKLIYKLGSSSKVLKSDANWSWLENGSKKDKKYWDLFSKTLASPIILMVVSIKFY